MHAYVVRTEWKTPTLVRVVLGGGSLDGFAMVAATDAYVNLAFPPEAASYGGVFDPAVIRATQARHDWPARRRFTVRSWDEISRQLTIDFVVHGDEGVAGRWASSTAIGDVLVFDGPAGGYRPEPTADWHLFVGDESALPAIASSVEALTPDALAVVRVVCDGPEHHVELNSPATTDVEWLHRVGTPQDGQLLASAVQDLAFPRGSGHAFVHGEAEEIRAVRRHLLRDRGWARAGMSCSPYWRRTMTDEAWRAVKRDFVTAMEAEIE